MPAYAAAIPRPPRTLTELEQASLLNATERSYSTAKQRVEHISTKLGAAAIQDLGYGYDDRRLLDRRTDALQPRSTAERSGWNPYSYVHGMPLDLVDPSGFEPAYEPPPVDPEYSKDPEVQRILAAGCLGLECAPKAAGPVAGSREAAESGAAPPPVDVSTTGNASGYVPQPMTAAPTDGRQAPLLQLEGGFVAGLLLGGVPFAGVGEQLLDATGILPDSTPEARLGLAVGQIVGGLFATAGGVGGEVLGGIASATGIGAAIGMPAIAVSTTVVLGGAANVAAGIRGLAHVMLSEGAGLSAPKGTPHDARRPSGGKPAVEGDPWSPEQVARRSGTTATPNGPLAAKALGYDQRIPPPESAV